MCSFGCWRPTYERFFLAFSRRHNKLEINQWARQNSRPLIPHERQQNFHPQLERFKNLDPPIVQGSVNQLFGCNHDVKLARYFAHIFQLVGGPIVVQSPFENSNVYPPVIKHKTAEDFPAMMTPEGPPMAYLTRSSKRKLLGVKRAARPLHRRLTMTIFSWRSKINGVPTRGIAMVDNYQRENQESIR